jgi:hypothetical protein
VSDGWTTRLHRESTARSEREHAAQHSATIEWGWRGLEGGLFGGGQPGRDEGRMTARGLGDRLSEVSTHDRFTFGCLRSESFRGCLHSWSGTTRRPSRGDCSEPQSSRVRSPRVTSSDCTQGLSCFSRTRLRTRPTKRGRLAADESLQGFVQHQPSLQKLEPSLVGTRRDGEGDGSATILGAIIGASRSGVFFVA